MPRKSSYRSEVITEPTFGVVAAAKNYSVGKLSGKGRSFGDSWQEAAWDFYDIIPELRYSADFVGNLLSRAVLYPTKDGVRTTDKLAVTALQDLFGGEDGQSEMLRQLGVNYTVAGEAMILGLVGDDGDQWEVVATVEAKGRGDGSVVIGGDHLIATPGKSLVIRLWHEHPRKPWKPNSPTRACLAILNELNKLTQHVDAQITSRLISAGIVWIPQEMSLPSTPVARTDDTGETVESAARPAGSTAQALSDILTEVAGIAIRDRSDAAAMVPIFVQVAGEFLDKINKTEFWSGLDAEAINLRKEAIGRLALGMDMPPEILTGMSDTNHWTGWLNDESAIKSHAEPLLDAILYALSTGYMQKVLAADMPKEDAARYGIAADTSKMRARPNRSKEAVELWDRGELSGEALRRENGFIPEDAMDDVEKVAWLTKKLAQGQTTPELVAEGLRLLGVKLPDLLALPDTDHEARPTRTTEDHPVRDMPDTQDSVPDHLVAAAEMMVFRALERAGNRLKTRVGQRESPVPAKDLYQHVPRLTDHEVDDLMVDAWACTEWVDTGDVDAHELAACLDSYTRMLLATRTGHERPLLRSRLALSLALQPMRV